MKDDLAWTGVLFLLMAFIVGLSAGLVVGAACVAKTTKSLRCEAVQHGAARWDTDADGNTEFHWLGEEKK